MFHAARPTPLSRRAVLTGLGAIGLVPFADRARAAGLGGALLATELDIDPASSADQTAVLQAALEKASGEGRGLFLPAGTYRLTGLDLPDFAAIGGIPGKTRLMALSERPLVRAADRRSVVMEGLVLDGGARGPTDGQSGLLALENVETARLDAIEVRGAARHGGFLRAVGGTVSGCTFRDVGSVGLFSLDARGLAFTGNTVIECGNGGILVWRSQAGPDGTIVSGNRIAGVRAVAGGSGQNGNGINVFRAGEVIVADNHIADCAFSAIRVNGARDSQIRGNTCRDLSEVAIFSEFGFDGSVIADNIVDGAAGGISMTNFDRQGRMATCSGNIVRNVLASSPTNENTVPFGIHAEADTAVTGNLVEAVPGKGISAGWGRYLRDVAVTGNVIRGARIGIAVSVAEGAGAASVTGNLVAESQVAAIAGMRWSEIADANLAENADRYPQLTIAGNTIR